MHTGSTTFLHHISVCHDYITSNDKMQVLKDIDSKGKDRSWKERKRQSLSLADAFSECQLAYLVDAGYTQTEAQEILSDLERLYIPATWQRKSDATGKCADVLEFVRTEEGKLKLYRAWFCKDRLCPMCNWRRAMKFSVQIAQILQEMKKREITGRPIFLTLTMRNVKGEDIGESFSHFAESFHRLMMYKAVKDYCIGAIRTSEITYNAKRDDYNTHIHCLVWMRPGYFRGNRYLSQEKWTSLWKRAARLDYTPVVNVKAVKPKEPTERDPTGLYAAVLEVSKYPIKPDVFTSLTTKAYGETPEMRDARLKRIRDLERGMKRKRLISFFGIFKEIRRELQLDDAEDGDLIGADGTDDTAEILTVETYMYDRAHGDYLHSGTESIRNDYGRDYHTK